MYIKKLILDTQAFYDLNEAENLFRWTDEPENLPDNKKIVLLKIAFYHFQKCVTQFK